MARKKHILFLTPGFPENELDTTCIPALQLFVNALQRTDEVMLSVITFQYPYKAAYYTWNNIKVYAIGGQNKKGLIRFLNWKKVVKAATKINIENPIDLVHSFWLTECAFVGNQISRKLAVKHSCTLMGQDALSSNKYLSKLKQLPDIITLSDFHAKTLFDNAKIKSKYIIPWGIENIEKTAEVKRDIDVIGVGNYTSLKAFDRFILVINDIKKQFPAVKAEIIGEGTEMEKLQNLIDNNGLMENVRLVGKMSRDAVLQKMRRSKCLLHLSNYESFGMVLLEALGQGTKVFSTNVGIAGEIKEITIVKDGVDASIKVIDFLKDNPIIVPIMLYPIDKTVKSYLEKVFLKDEKLSIER